jgi:hypothetical protein
MMENRNFSAAPHQYWHNRTGEDNADVHLKRKVMGREVVAVTNGWLDFGPWEQILYGSSTGRGSGCRSRSSARSGAQSYAVQFRCSNLAVDVPAQ